jgi:hypothetical protein
MCVGNFDRFFLEFLFLCTESKLERKGLNFLRRCKEMLEIWCTQVTTALLEEIEALLLLSVVTPLTVSSTQNMCKKSRRERPRSGGREREREL